MLKQKCLTSKIKGCGWYGTPCRDSAATFSSSLELNAHSVFNAGFLLWETYILGFIFCVSSLAT